MDAATFMLTDFLIRGAGKMDAATIMFTYTLLYAVPENGCWNHYVYTHFLIRSAEKMDDATFMLTDFLIRGAGKKNDCCNFYCLLIWTFLYAGMRRRVENRKQSL